MFQCKLAYRKWNIYESLSLDWHGCLINSSEKWLLWRTLSQKLFNDSSFSEICSRISFNLLHSPTAYKTIRGESNTQKNEILVCIFFNNFVLLSSSGKIFFIAPFSVEMNNELSFVLGLEMWFFCDSADVEVKLEILLIHRGLSWSMQFNEDFVEKNCRG